MAYVKADTWILQQIAATGLPLVGGSVHAYVWDTSTPLAMYTNSAGSGSATSFTLNSLGMPQSAGGTAIDIYLDDAYVYKFILRDSDGVAVGPTIGPVYPGGGNGLTGTMTSMEALRASSVSFDYIETVAFYEDGSTGAAKLYRDGTGTPTGSGAAVIAAALAAGTFCNAAGVCYKLRTDQKITPYMFGAIGDEVADDYEPVQLWLDFGGGFATKGRFLNATAPWEIDAGRVIFGAGRDPSTGTLFKSALVGMPLFKPADDTVNGFYLADFRCDGNNVTGAGGSGHCFSLIDPVAGGSWSPQSSTIERVEIRYFRGLDNRDRGGVNKINSAGIMMYQPLQIVLRDVHALYCAHGWYVEETQNCRFYDCIGSYCDNYAIFTYNNDNLLVQGGDFLNSGNGVTDSGYMEAGLGTGNVGSFRNKGSVWVGNKVKESVAGTANVNLRFTYGEVWRDNWIRPNMQTDVPQYGIYAYRCPGLKVEDNTFSLATSAHANLMRSLTLYNDQTTEVFDAKITGNRFEDPSGTTVDWHVKLLGNSTSRAFKVNITDNTFGEITTLSAAGVVTNDIVLENCAVRQSTIGRNTHYAPTNSTRTACVSASSITNEENNILPSAFASIGGTITAEYSGITESILTGSASYNPPNLPTGTQTTTTVTVTGAALGDYAEASFLLSTQGIDVFAFVSAADTVTVVFRNDTGGSIDLGSSTLRVKVKKATASV